MAGKNKLKWKETKPGRWEAGDFAIVQMGYFDSISDYIRYALYYKGRIKDFFDTKTKAKGLAEKLNKKDD